MMICHPRRQMRTRSPSFCTENSHTCGTFSSTWWRMSSKVCALFTRGNNCVCTKFGGPLPMGTDWSHRCWGPHTLPTGGKAETRTTQVFEVPHIAFHRPG